MAFSYKTVTGNALDYIHNPPGKLVIPHVCNDIGVMGSGVAYFIAKKWPKAEDKYVEWYQTDVYNLTKHRFNLGEVQFVDVGEDVIVANMIGQKNVGENEFGMPPIRMDSLRECLYRLRKFIVENNVVSVASPKFGSLRAGGNWETIEELIKLIFDKVDVEWITYEFQEPSFGRKQVKNGTS